MHRGPVSAVVPPARTALRRFLILALIGALAASLGILDSQAANARQQTGPQRSALLDGLHKAAAGDGRVVSFPGPGWRTASPSTTVTFRGAGPRQLGAVRVQGSQSGLHDGRLVGAKDGIGATFYPDKPFRPGERVTVTSAVRVMGSSSTRFSFTVGTPAGGKTPPIGEPDEAVAGGLPAAPSASAVTCHPVRPRFHSRPGLTPEGACVGHAADHVQSGLVLTTPHATYDGQHGPTIYDNRGNIIWYQPLPYYRTWNLSVVTYNGERLLAVYVQRRRQSGLPDWQYLLLDKHYRTVARVGAKNGYRADLHEFQVTPDGKALVGAYNRVIDPVSKRLTTEYVVQEIDIASNTLLFEWHSLDHVPTAASYRPPPTNSKDTWDYFHGNAISPLPDGNLLVSARNTSTVYDLSTQTGDVVWRLGGKQDDFDIVSAHPGWQFCYQHDVRSHGAGVLSVFDNGSAGPRCPRHVARAEMFTYDVNSMTVQRVTNLDSTTASASGAGYFARALGSARQLLNDDWIVSWGMVPHITEFDSSGDVDFDMTLSFRTYRTVRAAWTGEPLDRPALAARRDKGVVTAWASWNGSTRLGAWRLLTGPSPSDLHVFKEIGRHGFETRVRARTGARYVAVQALDHHGTVLAQSLARRPS